MARNRRFRSTTPRRRMFWAQQNVMQTTTGSQPIGNQPLNLLGEFEDEYGADLFGFTVTRIRGHLTFAFDQTDVVERHDPSYGIRVSSEAQTATTNTNLERLGTAPVEDPHADWMWVYNDTLYTNLNTGWMYAQYKVDVDIKAQRRLDELGQSLYLFSAWGGSDFTSFVNVFISLRILCKRP